MRNLLFFCSLTFIISCNSTPERNQTNETIREWVFPKVSNWKMLENIASFETTSLENSQNLNLKEKRYYFDLSDSEMGITEISLFNDVPASSNYKLVKISDRQIQVMITQNKGGQVSDTSIHNYQNNNTFCLLPNQKDTSHWVYVDGQDHYDSCSSYWGKVKIHDTLEQVLIIERNGYLIGSNEFAARDVETYQKDKGIFEIDKFGRESGKLILKYVILNEGIEKLNNNMFPLSLSGKIGLKSENESKPTSSTINSTEDSKETNSIELPSNIEYKGKYIDAIKYEDKNGTNYVIISEIKNGQYGKEGYTDVLFGCGFSGNGQTFKKLWEIQEASDIVSEMEYIKGSLKFDDIDNDGVFENIFLYKKSGDGAGAIPLKLMLHSGSRKYPIRGEYCPEKEVCGDYSKMSIGDEFSNAPLAFKSYSTDYWNKTCKTLIK